MNTSVGPPAKKKGNIFELLISRGLKWFSVSLTRMVSTEAPTKYQCRPIEIYIYKLYIHTYIYIYCSFRNCIGPPVRKGTTYFFSLLTSRGLKWFVLALTGFFPLKHLRKIEINPSKWRMRDETPLNITEGYVIRYIFIYNESISNL